MIYIEEDDKIVCYKVTIDKEKLKLIRLKIIYNCSLITDKITEETTTYLISNEFYNVYSCDYIKSIDRDYYIEDVYKITYEKLLHPPIIKKIDKLLKEDYSVLSTIFENNSIKEEKIKEFNIRKQEIINRLNEIDISQNKNIINIELENLKRMYSFKNIYTIEEVSNYYDEISKCIVIEKINAIDKNVYKVVFEFFKDYFKEDLIILPNINKNYKIKKLK